ncbi:MAG: DEAD/DEAH box helicase, partial [Chloroflexota bacterium]
PVLREMEERGRVRRGYFVEGLGGAQFCLPAALDRLRAERADAAGDRRQIAPLLLAASDPANPYGAALPWPRWSDEDRRPLARAAGAYVVIVDGQPTVYLERGGRSLQTLPAFADREMAAASLIALRGLLADGRFRSLSLEKVDGQPVADSPHSDTLAEAGFQRSYRGWLLRA